VLLLKLKCFSAGDAASGDRDSPLPLLYDSWLSKNSNQQKCLGIV